MTRKWKQFRETEISEMGSLLNNDNPTSLTLMKLLTNLLQMIIVKM